MLPEELPDNLYSIYFPRVVDNILKDFSCRRRTTFTVNSLKTREGDVINEFREKGIKPDEEMEGFYVCKLIKHKKSTLD
jgi:hypothetical protein